MSRDTLCCNKRIVGFPAVETRCVVFRGGHILAAISSTHLSKKPLVAVPGHDKW